MELHFLVSTAFSPFYLFTFFFISDQLQYAPSGFSHLLQSTHKFAWMEEYWFKAHQFKQDDMEEIWL